MHCCDLSFSGAQEVLTATEGKILKASVLTATVVADEPASQASLTQNCSCVTAF